MECNESPDDPQTKGSKTLLVRHLPAELSVEEKQDLLKYFGAECVRVLSTRGRLALSRLHQLEVLNQTLVAEFAKGQDHITVLKEPPVSESGVDIKEEQKRKEIKVPRIPLIETGVAPSLGLKFAANPTLKYLYPPPSHDILANISHALISVPRFYVQVLHLMNKMNLPCPFGPLTARPPLVLPAAPPVPMPPPFPPDYPPLPAEKMERSSEEESEYESGEEEKARVVQLRGVMANRACKRPPRPKTATKRKKPKIKDLLYVPKLSDSHSAAATLTASDVFEQPQAVGPKKIEFNISASEMGAVVEGNGVSGVHDYVKGGGDPEVHPGSREEATEAEGFGKLFPSIQSSQQPEELSDDDRGLPADVITRKELEKGRLSRDELKRMSVFKNYEAGEPTCRLYVKNVAKQVEEKDLKYIYGRYIERSSEAERNMFDIVLMKEGRMKGQAFVGLPSEQSAEKALRETNGYVLYDKPLVVQFARSARPKAEPADAKRSSRHR